MNFKIAIVGMMLSVAAPVAASVYEVRYTGNVTTVEGDAQGSTIVVGDLIAAQFRFDDSLVGSPTFLPLGGGIYTNYYPWISAFTLSVGSYETTSPQLGAALTYADNSFGQDILTFGVSGLVGGPFGSTFGNVQFQGRGGVDALDGSGIGNGLPYDRLTPSFFAVFSNGSTAKRVFGNLEVSLSAVPEPATWIMMIVGFAVVGLGLRYQQSQKIVNSGYRQSKRLSRSPCLASYHRFRKYGSCRKVLTSYDNANR